MKSSDILAFFFRLTYKKSLATQKIRKGLLELEKVSVFDFQNYFNIHITYNTENIDHLSCIVLAVLLSQEFIIDWQGCTHRQ